MSKRLPRRSEFLENIGGPAQGKDLEGSRAEFQRYESTSPWCVRKDLRPPRASSPIALLKLVLESHLLGMREALTRLHRCSVTKVEVGDVVYRGEPKYQVADSCNILLKIA